MSYTWFKLHHDLPGDIKIKMFTPQEKWAWIALLCLASQGKNRGEIAADNDDIAGYCEFNCTQDWLYFRDKLISKGMLEFNASGGLKVVHWEDRQYGKPSDRPEAIKERVSKHRSRKKEKNETLCNALHKKRNADVTPQTRSDLDLDKEEDLEDLDKSNTRESEAKIADAIASECAVECEVIEEGALPLARIRKPTEEDFDRFWKIAEIKVDKAKTRTEFLKIKNADPDDVIHQWQRQQDFHMRKNGSTQFLKRPLTWVKGRCWEDELEPTYGDVMPKQVVQSAKFISNVERMRQKYGEGYKGQASTKTLKELSR